MLLMEPDFALDRCTLRLVDLFLLLLALIQFVPIIQPALVVLHFLPLQIIQALVIRTLISHAKVVVLLLDPDFRFHRPRPLKEELVGIIENLKPLVGFHQPELPRLVGLR